MLTDWLQEKNSLICKIMFLKLNFQTNTKYLHGLSYLHIGKSMKIIRKYKETSAEGETLVLKLI